MLGWEVIPRIPIGNLSVSPHGVGIAVGYFLGATLMARRARRTGFDEDHAWNAAVVGILGAIVGARIAYVVGHSDQFNKPIEYLQIYKGGISLMGGLIGGFLAAWLYCRSKKLDFLRLADLGAAGLAIGTAVGRIGDLVIGDHLGRTTDGFWGWEYKGGELISSPPCDPAVYPSPDGCIQPGMVVHQTALYDSIWALVIFLVLLRLERKPHPKGFLVLTWAAMYSLGRILTDFTRVDKTWFGTGLTGSQLTAIAVLVLSLVLLTLRRKSPVVAAVSPGKGTAGATPPEKPAGEAEDSEATPLVPVEPVDPAAPEAAAPGEPVDPAVPVGAALPDIEQDSQPAAERPSEPIQEEPDALSTVEEEASVAGADEPRMPAPETVGAVDAAEALVVEASLPLDAPVGEADPGDVAEVAALVETQEAAAEPAVESLFPADIEQVQAEQQVRAEQPETEDRDPERQNPETELLAVTPDEPTAAGPEPGVPETPEQD